MTGTAWALLILCGLTALLCVAFWLAERTPPEGHVPRHGRWIQDGITTRLTPPSRNTARAGVLLPSEKLLAPAPGEDEWTLPPVPGTRGTD